MKTPKSTTNKPKSDKAEAEAAKSNEVSLGGNATLSESDPAPSKLILKDDAKLASSTGTPTGSKPEAAKPATTKPVELKPEAPKPADTGAVFGKPGNAGPTSAAASSTPATTLGGPAASGGTARPVESKPVESKSADAKPSDTGSSDSRPASPPGAAYSKPEPAPVTVRRTGFWPVFLGGVAAAAIGAAAAWWAIPHLPPSWRPGGAGTPGLDEQISAQVDASVKSALAALPAPAAPDQGMQAALDAQAQQIAALDESIKALQSAPAGAAPDGLDQTLTQMQTTLDRQSQEIQALKDRPAGTGVDPAQLDAAVQQKAAELQQQMDTAVSKTREDLAAAQAEAQKLQADAAETGRRARGAAALALLQAALETGNGLDAALAELGSAGVPVPEGLGPDTPSLVDLNDAFDAAARAGLTASLRADSANEGIGTRLGNFLRVQTGARSLEPQQGTDPDAVLSRAAEAVRNGEIQGALDEIETLPAAGQDAMNDWTAMAQAWVGANTAVAQLGAELK
ncbi:COG4223 family protein [Paracoccus pacificus]|uniref:Inner membrane protein n=1 Tax=Paracoccus pacificus TaxID=1463598 RepID=A0ABW4R2X7_9RHOB